MNDQFVVSWDSISIRVESPVVVARLINLVDFFCGEENDTHVWAALVTGTPSMMIFHSQEHLYS